MTATLSLRNDSFRLVRIENSGCVDFPIDNDDEVVGFLVVIYCLILSIAC